jgi:Cu-Zn family superoxide dismutase
MGAQMKRMVSVIAGGLAIGHAVAATVTAEVKTTSNATPIGTVEFVDTEYGLLIKPDLTSLNPGIHGFHIHQHPNCEHAGMSAAGHFDPQKTDKHKGPYSNGHLGDLPALYVDQSGSAKQAILAPRLKTSDIINHSVMIHEGGDNYSDKPAALGGGGSRAACGLIQGQASSK